MMNVAIYIRISTNHKSQKGSIENQKKQLIDYCKSKGYIIFKIYVDIGSGMSSNRKGFKQLIEDAKEKKFGLVLSKELSRLARNARLSLEFKDIIMSNEIHIITLDGAINTIENGVELFGLYAWVYENESRNTSRRIKPSMRSVAQSGSYTKGDPPYGYIVEEGVLKVRDDETPSIVRKIFSLYIEGRGRNYIMRYLTDNNIRTPGQIKGRCDVDGKWQETTVLLILKNRHYIGDLVQCKESTPDISIDKNRKENKYKRIKNEEPVIVENTHEAIISREDYFTVQRMLSEKSAKSKNRSSPQRYLFSDKLYCNECGKRLWIISNRGYYVCGTYKRYGSNHCSIHKVKEAELSEIIKNDLISYSERLNDFKSIEGKIMRKIKDSKVKFEKRQSSLHKKLEKLKKKKGNLVLKWMDESLTQDQYELALAVVDEDINYHEKQLDALVEENNYEKQIEALNNVRAQLELLKTFDEINREVINRFVDKVVVHEDSSVDIHYAFSNENID